MSPIANRILLLVTVLIFAANCGGGSTNKGLTADSDNGTDDTSAPTPDTQKPDPNAGLTKISDTLYYVELKGQETGSFGVSNEMQFNVDDTTVSFLITVKGEPGFMYGMNWMKDPTGDEIVVETNDPSLCVPCKNRVAGSEGVAAFLFPNTPTVQIKPGKYSFRVSSFKLAGQGGFPSTAKFDLVIYFYKKNPRPPVGQINLNFHFTGAGNLTAANAGQNANFLKALEEFKTIYQQVGITVGEVRLRDVGTEYKTIESMFGADNDFSKLVEQSKGNQDGINLFMVSRISDSSQQGGFGVILGVSGGIPGPGLDQGTRRSGVAVVVEKTWFFNGEYGAVMAHEVGHFLGLFHSSEQPQLGIHDPIPDTKNNDSTNLMFYAGDLYIQDTSAGNKLTPDQGFVVLSNPMVHVHE